MSIIVSLTAVWQKWAREPLSSEKTCLTFFFFHLSMIWQVVIYFNHPLFSTFSIWSYLISFSMPWYASSHFLTALTLFYPFLPLPSQCTFPLQLGLWSRQCLRLSLRGTPLSCTATWLATQLQRSNGGMLKSTELTPSSSCGMEPASVGYPSTQPMGAMGSVCSASRASHWRTLEPMSAGPATTPGAMTSDKILPSPGSAPRPPFRSYRVSVSCPLLLTVGGEIAIPFPTHQLCKSSQEPTGHAKNNHVMDYLYFLKLLLSVSKTHFLNLLSQWLYFVLVIWF